MILYLLILVPIIAGALIYLIKNKNVFWFAFFLQAGLLVVAIYNFVMVQVNGPYDIVLGNFTTVAGITLRCDTLSSALVLLTVFIYFVCFIFGILDKFMTRLFVFFFLTLQSMIVAIFLSRDLFNVYILTEVSTIVVSVLIMYKKDGSSLYDGMIYLITNITAMTFFLFGIAFTYRMFGTLNMDLIASKMYEVNDVRTLALPFAFLITGVGLKCAFLPIFSWLPKAHATTSAPSVVAVILSALYVKSGIFHFIKLREMFMPAINMDQLFLIIGVATGVAGFILAMSQKDIKLILAYHTISQLGLVLVGISSGSQFSYFGGILHLFNHAIFKSLLFLTAGIITDEYNERNMHKIRGVFKRMPYVSIMMITAMLGITGAPLFNGSVSKYMIESGVHGRVLEYEVMLINLGTIISFIKLADIFKGGIGKSKIHVDFWKKTAITIMGIMCLAMGIAGPLFISSIFNYRVYFSFIDFMKNLLIFSASLGIGWLVYYKWLKNTKFIQKGFALELGINGIAMSVTGFFAFLVAAVYIFA
jgi:multicomponent Na+:H+ antiporter subunit D